MLSSRNSIQLDGVFATPAKRDTGRALAVVGEMEVRCTCCVTKTAGNVACDPRPHPPFAQRRNRNVRKEVRGEMLILLEDYTINDLVRACPYIMHTNRSAHFDFGSRRIRVENLAASGHVSDRFAEAIVHRSVGLLKNDCTARRELSDRSRAFSSSGGRACGLPRHVLSLHKRLLNGLSPRKRGHGCQGDGQ